MCVRSAASALSDVCRLPKTVIHFDQNDRQLCGKTNHTLWVSDEVIIPLQQRSTMSQHSNPTNQMGLVKETRSNGTLSGLIINLTVAATLRLNFKPLEMPVLITTVDLDKKWREIHTDLIGPIPN